MEFQNYVKYSNELFKKIPIHKQSINKKVRPLMQNPFIRSFWIESEKNQFSWKAYLTRVEAFEEFLKDRFSINIDIPKIEGRLRDPIYKELERAVQMADFNKSQYVVAHDAYHIWMISELRKEEAIDELGMNSYFLTCDYTLNFAERLVHRGSGIPSNISIDIWAQIILPFISPKVVLEEESNIYTKIMASKFPVLTKSINPQDLVELMGIWMDDPSVDTPLLRRLFGKKFLKENLARLRKIGEKKPG